MLQPRNKAIIICSEGTNIKELANHLYISETVYVMYVNKSNNGTQFVSLIPDKLLVEDVRTPQIYVTDSISRYKVRELLKEDEYIELYVNNGPKEITSEELLNCNIIEYKDIASTYLNVVDTLYLLGALV